MFSVKTTRLHLYIKLFRMPNFSSVDNKVKILDTDVDNISNLDLIKEIRNGGVVFTPNVDHLVKLQNDPDFYQAYKRADFVVCDSQILQWISRLLNSKNKIEEKICGSDFFPSFYQYYKKDEKIKIFLLGGVEGTAKRAKQEINKKLESSVVVGAHSPSIGFETNEEECQEVIDLINDSGATVLAVGLGAPKQEKWIVKHEGKLKKVKIFLAVGATIDFEAGIVKRAPKWMSDAGLEWLHRLVLDPKRLWKRYLVDALPFFWLVLLQKLDLYRSPQDKLKSLKSPILSNGKRKKNSHKPSNIVMFGPCLFEHGGMGAVQQHIVNNVGGEVKIKHVVTWNGKVNTFSLFSRAIIKFLYLLIKDRVDIVHLHVSERGSVVRKTILALLAFAFSKPVIMHTHGCEFHVFYENLPKVAQKLLNKIWQNCTRIIVLSKSWKQVYTEKCGIQPDRILVKYNPVAIPQSSFAKDSSKKITFVLLGKINQRKGVFDLFEATALLPSDYREKMEVVIAGSGEIEKATSLAKELKIDSLVSFPGWIDSEQRDRLLESSDVFVLPSYNEGLPMALLEAMSWKLPVLTTPVGGIPEIIIHNETGLLVEPGNVEELSTLMKTLIDNKTIRQKLGKAAYEQALLLDTKNYSNDILDIYNSVLAENEQKECLELEI